MTEMINFNKTAETWKTCQNELVFYHSVSPLYKKNLRCKNWNDFSSFLHVFSLSKNKIFLKFSLFNLWSNIIRFELYIYFFSFFSYLFQKKLKWNSRFIYIYMSIYNCNIHFLSDNLFNNKLLTWKKKCKVFSYGNRFSN